MNAPQPKTVTVPALREMKRAGQRIVALTAYDASFAIQAERAGVDVVLVGDSLGMVIQGLDHTLSVSLADMVYHTQIVARGLSRSLLMADLPFMSDRDLPHALEAAAQLVAEGGAAIVKMEGAAPHQLEIIAALQARDIPLCAHLGLTPQSVHTLGGFKVQGRAQAAAERLLAQAQAVEQAGAAALVLEAVPSALGRTISKQLTIPVIGIGAGPDCDGQILVMHDLLGLTPGQPPRFSKNFLPGRDSVQAALQAYAEEVRAGQFPGPEHSFQ